MTGNDVALDTSAAIKLLNDGALATRFLARAGRVHLCSIAAGELLYGAMNSGRHIDNVPRYRGFIEHCVLLPISLDTAKSYARLRLDLKSRGNPIPDADIWIAAAAIENSMPLVTTDQHFSRVNGLTFFPLDDAPPA